MAGLPEVLRGGGPLACGPRVRERRDYDQPFSVSTLPDVGKW